MKQDQDYNRIKEWLVPQLRAKGLSVERFARMCGLTRAVVYFYLNDQSRPSEEAMFKMCEILGVPYEEGLRQYTPKKEGRPYGYSPTQRVAIRHR